MQANSHGVRNSIYSQMSESRSGDCIRERKREKKREWEKELETSRGVSLRVYEKDRPRERGGGLVAWLDNCACA